MESNITIKKERLKFLLECTSNDPTNRVLQCVHFATNGYAYATDGHRLAGVSIPRLEQSFIVHRSELEQKFKGHEKTIMLNQSTFSDQYGTYPQAELLVPNIFQSELVLQPNLVSQLTTILNSKTGLSFVMISLSKEGIRWTEGIGDRVLTPTGQEWRSKNLFADLKVVGSWPFDLVFGVSLMKPLRRFKWDTLKTNRHLDQVVFEDSVSKDFYLVMPRIFSGRETTTQMLSKVSL
jgi:hypothetical protein